MAVRLVLAILALTCRGCLSSTFLCGDVDMSSAKFDPPVPALPNQFEARMEINISEENKTVNVVEHFDGPGNRTSVTMTSWSETVTTIVEFDNSWRYDIKMFDESCQVTKWTGKDAVNGFNLKNRIGQTASISDIFKFFSGFEMMYVGRSQIREIPVDHWSLCQYSSPLQTTLKLDYYFSQEGYHTASGHNQIPVRATVSGTVSSSTGNYYNFHHDYEIMFFRTGPVQETVMFQIPRGVMCKGRQSTKSMPQLPDQFMADMEVVHMNGKREAGQKVYYDYPSQLVRTDMYMERPTFGMGSVTKIEDYKTGTEYFIDVDGGNCTVRPLQDDKTNMDPNHVTMMHTKEFLFHNIREFVYQGERTFRNMLVDVWTNKSTDGMIEEVYFLKNTNSMTIVGIYLTDRSARLPGHHAESKRDGAKNKIKRMTVIYETSEKVVNVYNFVRRHPAMDVFDIRPCYQVGHSEMELTFMVTGNYDTDVRGYQSGFLTAAGPALASAAGVQIYRITDLTVKPSTTDRNQLKISFILLDDPPVAGRGFTHVSLQQARDNLVTSMEAGLTFTASYSNHFKQFRVLHLEQSLPKVAASVRGRRTYTSSETAGLGIGLLVTGCLLGVVLAAIVLVKLGKKDRMLALYSNLLDKNEANGDVDKV